MIIYRIFGQFLVYIKNSKEEVEQQLTKLMEILLDEGRLEDLKRITKEKEYREELYRAYHIK